MMLMLFGESGTKISNGTRYLVLGILLTFMGIVKLWFWFSGFANQFALWFGILFCSAGLYFILHGWLCRARIRDSSEDSDVPRNR